MKKLITMVVLSPLFVSLVVAQIQINHWKKMGLNGKVKSIIWRDNFGMTDSSKAKADSTKIHPDSTKNRDNKTYLFNDKGGLLEEIHYTIEGVPSLHYIYKHDDMGKIIEDVNKLSGETTTYKHDDKGNIIEYRESKNGETTTYKYDAKGNVIEASAKNNRDVTTYKYDEKGNLIEIHHKISGGKVLGMSQDTESKSIFTYDDKGICIEEKIFVNADRITTNRLVESHTKTFLYDDKGNRIEDHYTNPKGKPDGKLIYKFNDNNILIERSEYNLREKLISNVKYDDNGNEIERSRYTDRGKLVKPIYTFTYEYDKNLNWIKRYDGIKGINFFRVRKREIEYF